MRDVRMDRERGMSTREQKKRGGMKEGNRERRFGLAVGCNDR